MRFGLMLLRLRGCTLFFIGQMFDDRLCYYVAIDVLAGSFVEVVLCRLIELSGKLLSCFSLYGAFRCLRASAPVFRMMLSGMGMIH